VLGGSMIGFIKRRLELQIITAIVCVLGLVIGIYTVIDIRIMRTDTIRASRQSLGALAGTVKGSVTAAMRQGYHEDVQRIIEEARTSFGVDRILIYNAQGKALRRSGLVNKEDEGAWQISQAILHNVSAGDKTDIHEQAGKYYLSYYSPIANQAACFRCHSSQNSLNGILRIDFSLHGVETLIASRRNSMLLWTVVMIASLMAALVVLLRLLVHKPVEELRNAMAQAETGSEEVRLSVKGFDELSDLKRGFVSMLDRINALHRSNLEKEKELARSQEIMRFRAELQTMFDAMPDGVLLIDTDMNIIQSNPRAYELLPGLKSVWGRIPYDRVKEESCPHHGLQDALTHGEVREHHCSIKLPGGTERHVHSICAPIQEEGQVVYVVEVIRDITERVNTERELEEKTAELLAANRLLSRIAITDGLTQVHNRRHFDELLYKEIKRYNRRKYSHLSLMMIDIDHFKKLNDRYGHLAGDAVLREIAKLLKENVRETDTVARYGGEEFVVVMPDTHLDGAAYRAEALRKIIENKNFPGYDAPITATVSIGVAAYFSGPPQDIIHMADQALYQAKNFGRNAIVVSRPDVTEKG
jgi:diguanylate cyclase (GGDEF)-like protein/PAS domain S-box-containing protein